MKSKVLFLIVVFISESIIAQNTGLLPFKVNNQWGYIDYDGAIQIAPQYDFAGRFRNNISIVKKNNKYGLIDANNNFSIQPVYDEIRSFNDSIYLLRLDSLWGTFSRNSASVIPPFARELYPDRFGFFIFRQNFLSGIINQKGELLSNALYDSIYIFNNRFIIVSLSEKKGLLNNAGKELLSPNRFDKIIPATENCYLVSEKNNWGIAGNSNAIFIEPDWSSFQILSSAFIVLRNKNGSALYSVASKQLITDNLCSDFNLLNQHYVKFIKDDKYGLADKYKLLSAAVYDDLAEGNESVIKIMRKGNWGLLDTTGIEITPPSFYAIGIFNNHVATIYKNAQFGLINDKGKIIVQCSYRDIDQFYNSAKLFSNEKGVTIISLSDEGDLVDSTVYANFHTISVRGFGIYKFSSSQSFSADTIRVNQFAWFYSKKYKKWGLKNSKNDSILIRPSFNKVFVNNKVQRTVVQIFLSSTDPLQSMSVNKYRYGVIDNTTFRFILRPTYRDLRMEDVFNPDLLYARCITGDSKNGIVLLDGKERFIKYNFIGDITSDGLARVNIGGILKKLDEGKGTEDTIILTATCYLDAIGRIKSSLYTGIRTLANGIQSWNTFSSWTTTIRCSGGKWGYISRSGALVIKPQYTFAQSFTSGKAIIKNSAKYGVINTSGETIIPFNYNLICYLEGSSDSLFELKVFSARYGFSDRNGNIIADPQYEQAMDFSDGYSAVKQLGKWGFIDSTGQLIIAPQFISVTGFSEGLSAARLKNKWGYINASGEWEIKNTYASAGAFHNELAAVKINNSYSYIDKDGKVIIKGPFMQARDFSNGIAAVRVKKKFGFINSEGKWLIHPRYTSVVGFDESGFCKVKNGNKSGIVNNEGKVICGCRFDFLGTFSNGMAAASVNKKYGYIDTTGHWLIKPKYQLAGNFFNGTASVKLNDKFGLINTKGEWILDPLYSYCGEMKDGLIRVRQDGKISFVNADGKYVIARKYGMTQDFSEGITIVRESKYTVYFIDMAGNKLFNRSFDNAMPFKNGFAWVCIGCKWGLIDKSGLLVIEPKFAKAENFKNGFSKFRIDTQSGVANLEGQVIVAPEVEKIYYEGMGVFRIENGASIGYIDIKSNWVLAMNR